MKISKLILSDVIKEERELENILAEDSSVIEEGLSFIARQYSTPVGAIDLLCVDSEGSLVVIELKKDPSDTMLFQSLRYYAWVEKTRPRFSGKAGSQVNIEKPSRIILIAPSFSEALKEVVGYLQRIFQIDLMVYKTLRVDKNNHGIFCEKTEISLPPKVTPLPTVKRHLNRLQSDEMRQSCEETISWLKSQGLNVDPVQSYISFKEDGSLRAYISTAVAGYFNIYYLFEGETRKIVINNPQDLDEAKKELKNNLFTEHLT